MAAHKKSRPVVVPLAVALSVLMAAAAGGYALAGSRAADAVNLASAPGASIRDGTVYACLASGKLTRVSLAAVPKCPATSARVHWAGQSGPAGASARDGTVYACLASGNLTRVSLAAVPKCPATSARVHWAGQSGTAPSPSPVLSASPSSSTTSSSTTSPTLTPTSPTPSPTTPAPSSSTPSPTGTGWACVTSSPTGNCPDYTDPQHITMSNGYNTYVANNCWADPSCRQTVSANSPQDWQVVSTEPAGNGSVMTGPELQQQTNNWCPAQKTWGNLVTNGCPGSEGNAPIASLASLSSAYAETMPHDSGTIAEAAYDLWTNYSSDIMVWQDVVGRCSSGAFGGTTLATGVRIGNYTYDVYRYGGAGAEVIFVAEGSGGPGTCGNYGSGTVNLLGVLQEAQSLGVVSNVTVSLIDFTFEICSTGGVPETFAVSNYSVASTPSP